MSVGINIKKRRLELRMTQQELADAMGYKTRSTIAKIESGENDVSQKKLQKFASVLHTTVEALILDYTVSPHRINTIFPGNENSKNAVIILAGGKTDINRENIPCQFITVNEKPLLIYSMEAYQAHPAIDDIYVVCQKGWEHIVKAYTTQYGITKLKGLIAAGSSGINSLKNALDHIENSYADDNLIIIQEATRPLVNAEMISNLLQVCSEKGSATICHPMEDYVQFNLSGSKAEYMNRNSIVAVQSPEAHRFSLIKEVFQTAKMQQHPLTESCCTMLFYNLGYPINFIESSINNVKIARKEDLAAFSALIKS